MTVVIPIHYAEYSFQMVHSADPDPWYCTIGAEWDAVDGVTEDQALVAAYESWANAMSDVVSTEVAFTGAFGRFGQDGDPLTLWHGDSFEGGQSGDMLPQNCAALCSKQTALGGRKGKGRFYLPGVLLDEHVSPVGRIDNTLFNSLGAAVDQFGVNLTEGVATGTYPDVHQVPMLLHNDYGVDTPDPTPIVSVVVNRIIATQRRRLR